ncbi:hypothetical protein Tco_1280179, partial [Tanacetum coccineum]
MAKQHWNKVNEIRVGRLARTTNPFALVAHQQPVYHPQNHPTHYTQNSSTRPQQAATRNKGKAIINSPPPTYDQEHKMVTEDDALSKEKEIDKLMALISLSFKKIYKPTNNNLKTSSNTSRAYIRIILQELTELLGMIIRGQLMLLGLGRIEHPEQPESVNDTYLVEQDEHNIIIDSLDMSYDREQDDQDDNDDLAKKHDLLASLIAKLKCEINDSKNHNKYLETSNKALVDKLK